MSELRPIEVMISSQVNGHVGDPPKLLSDIRAEIAQRLRSIQVDGTSVMKVWLSEDQGALGQNKTTWDICMEEASRCDVLVDLYTGEAGWVGGDLGIGICHAEWETGFQNNPEKVRVVRFDGPMIKALKILSENAPANTTDKDLRFYRALDEGRTHRDTALTPDELVDKAIEAVWWAITDLVRSGRQAGARGRNLLGLSLRWANLDFDQRERVMLEALASALIGHPNGTGQTIGRMASAETNIPGGPDAVGRTVVRPIGGVDVAFQTHAVPGPFALPEARASLGQPLRDESALVDTLEHSGAVGPIHVVAVQQNVTETQIRRFIGRPDALVAAQSFGIFVSDDSSFTQALFLANCRDPDRVSNGVRLAFDWWRRAGLERTLAGRATARTAILKAFRDFAPRETLE